MKTMYLRAVVCLLALLSSVGMYSCKRDSPKDTKLLLQSFSPEQGGAGENVELKGQNFSPTKNQNSVKFNGLTATVSAASSDGSSITVIIPENAVTGKITVKVGDQEVVSTKDFVVTSPPHATITDFHPKFGDPGSVVVISGSRFDPSSTVKIGSVECIIVKTEPNTITVQLPDQSNVFSGTFIVSANEKHVESASEFEVTNVWKPVNTTSTMNHWEGIAFAIGNKIYVAGGDGNNDVDEFDVATGNWKKVNVLQAAITNGRFGAVIVKDNKAFMGNFFTPALGATWLTFDPALSGTDAWTRLPDFPVQETYGGIAFNLNNQLYAGIGSGVGDFIAKFDPAANGGKGDWINKFVPVAPNRIYITHFAINGVGYFGGGYDGAINKRREFYKFDPAVSANTVTRLSDFPLAVVNAPGYALKGKGYVVFDAKPYEYSPVNNSWTETKYGIQTKPSWVQVVNDKAYAIAYTGQVYEYIPKR